MTRDEEGWLQLDTGSRATDLAAGSPLARGLELEPGGESMGVAGLRQTSLLARDLSISFAGHSTVVDAHVVDTPREGCGPDGLLGLDAMGQCAFVFGYESLAIGCGS